jgi:chromosome segregation ATPase
MFSSKRERSGAELLPNSGEALAERVDMLASTLSSTAAAMARTDGDIAGLRRELGSGLARVEELAAELRSRARASDVRELEKKLGALDFASARSAEPKRLDDVAAKIAMLAERVDTLGTTVATTASSVAGRDGEVASLRRLFDQSSPAAQVDEALRERVEDVAAASASASLRLESHGDEIVALASRVEALSAGVSELVERIDTVERERLALASSVADAAATRWLEVERSLAGLAERLDASEARTAAVSVELSRATSLWPAALRSLESKVDGLAGARSDPRDTGAAPQPAADTHVLAALRALEQRMRSADASAREEREVLLESLDRLAGRLDERLEPAHHEAEIVPFRVDS